VVAFVDEQVPAESVAKPPFVSKRWLLSQGHTDNLIALCLLDRGGHCPPLPVRA